MTRNAIFDEFARARVRCDDGLAFRTDDAIERVHRFWMLRGAKSDVTVGIDTDGDGNEMMIWIDSHPPAGDLFAGLVPQENKS